MRAKLGGWVASMMGDRLAEDKEEVEEALSFKEGCVQFLRISSRSLHHIAHRSDFDSFPAYLLQAM